MTDITRKPKPGARAIGTYVAKALDPAARARGFATTALLSDWPAIVGRELAQFTMPDRVVWPRRREEAEAGTPIRGRRLEGATLVLRIEGPRAMPPGSGAAPCCAIATAAAASSTRVDAT